jgi:tetratricopeptide (TPR) repeat protein
MSALRSLEKRINTILLLCLILLVLTVLSSWERPGALRSGGTRNRADYAAELLAHGLYHEAVAVLQAEIDAGPTTTESLKYRRILAEIAMEKLGDYEKALAELVFIRSADPGQASATEDLVQQCMNRLGRVYDIQRRLLLAQGKNPLHLQVSSGTAVRIGNEEGIGIAELEQRLAQSGLPIKNPPQEQFDRVLQGMVSERLLARAAKRAKIDRHPRFLEQVRQFETNLALQKYLEEHILKDVTVDEQALQLFMEKHRDLFNSPLRVVYSALAFVDEASARTYLQGQTTATPPQTLADHQNAVVSELPRPLQGIRWETEPLKGPLGPIEIDGRWMVYPIHEVIPARKTSPELARQQARLKLLEEKQGGKISQTLTELAQKEELKVLDEALKQHFFPTASAPANVAPTTGAPTGVSPGTVAPATILPTPSAPAPGSTGPGAPATPAEVK